MYIGEKSVTASFNIIEDEVDIRFGWDMLEKNRPWCIMMDSWNDGMLGLNDKAITTPIFDANHVQTVVSSIFSIITQ